MHGRLAPVTRPAPGAVSGGPPAPARLWRGGINGAVESMARHRLDALALASLHETLQPDAYLPTHQSREQLDSVNLPSHVASISAEVPFFAGTVQALATTVNLAVRGGTRAKRIGIRVGTRLRRSPRATGDHEDQSDKRQQPEHRRRRIAERCWPEATRKSEPGSVAAASDLEAELIDR
jgi:hypothetical protein